MAERRALQATWTEIYSKILPSLARAQDHAQPEWPVTLDHCFGRIILDNTIGEGLEQWDKRLNRPAVRNMSLEQLKKAIELAERIKNGDDNLAELNLQSLKIRGEFNKKYGKSPTDSGMKERGEDKAKSLGGIANNRSRSKRKDAEQDDGKAAVRSPKKAKTSGRQSILSFAPIPNQVGKDPSSSPSKDGKTDLLPTIHKIKSHPALTPYRKRLYAALLSVPRGRYTTYAALSDFLGSSARAVGNGMRNNPFAPEVPCHRVLASDRSIGGFGGSWGVDGENASKKFDLLSKEGVKFESKRKVRGLPFRDFADLLDGG